MHESEVGKSWLDEVIREAVSQALEVVMETEREAFLVEQECKNNGQCRLCTQKQAWLRQNGYTVAA